MSGNVNGALATPEDNINVVRTGISKALMGISLFIRRSEWLSDTTPAQGRGECSA